METLIVAKVDDDNEEECMKNEKYWQVLTWLYHSAYESGDWELAESLIMAADPQTLNAYLSITLNAIWILSTQQELYVLIRLTEKIIANGAYEFIPAAKISLFLASCIPAFQSLTIDTDTDTEWGWEQFRELVKECEITLRCHDQDDKDNHRSAVEIQLQLSAFKTFLDLAANQLTSKDYSDLFHAACRPLLLCSSFNHGCASAIWPTTAIPGLLGMLVEKGVDHVTVNDRLLVASSTGSTELVRILLKVALINNLDVDVEQAFENACYYSRIGTMDCLVQDGNAGPFLIVLTRAAGAGCMPVVEWLVKTGCQEAELTAALVFATASSQVDVAAYLLHQAPEQIAERDIRILVPAGERGGVNCFDGVAFLLRSDFLGNPAATYTLADCIARNADAEYKAKFHVYDDDDDDDDNNNDDDDDNNNDDDGEIARLAELRAFLTEHWSEEAFLDGIRQGQEHYMNFMRILKRGESPICLDILDPDLRVAIAYLPLYQECVNAPGGCLVSQRLRGQLVEAVRRLGGGVLARQGEPICKELLAVLEHRLSNYRKLVGQNVETTTENPKLAPAK